MGNGNGNGNMSRNGNGNENGNGNGNGNGNVNGNEALYMYQILYVTKKSINSQGLQLTPKILFLCFNHSNCPLYNRFSKKMKNKKLFLPTFYTILSVTFSPSHCWANGASVSC